MAHEDFMPSTLDREISKDDQDAFGHRHYAKALKSLIESPSHETPFSIGLLGGWGTGKSSIKQLYTTELADDQVKEGKLTRHQRFHCITFNAWRFGGKDQDIKRALLRHVFLELGGEEENLHDRLFRQISESRAVPKTWREVGKELVVAWTLPLPALVFAIGLLVGLAFVTFKFLNVQDSLLGSAIFASLTFLFTYLLKNLKPFPVSHTRPVTKVSLPSTSSEQFEDMLLEQLKRYKSGAAVTPDKRRGSTCERLVVFVDDLDRLSAEEMVAGLDAVRTFMEIPKSRLPSGLGLVFVISCDEAKVADALAKGRRNADLPATVFNHSDARRYLDRIFQFRIEIPPPPRQDMRAFAMRHLQQLPGVVADLQRRGIALEPIVDRMIHVGVQDPRNALQIVNAFGQAWWLATKRELEPVGRTGGLHEGAVTAHPISLGALCALKVSFPDFYHDLQVDPGFLQSFTDVVVRGKPLKDQPLSAQQLLLEQYLHTEVLTDSTDPSRTEVRPAHRPLRQYIASLVGLRWPASLQSLLLLSEDPISRRLGVRGASVYAAFVSGDARGVVEGMGRHNDAAPLHADDARLLLSMYERLHNESNSRRINAARSVAELVERIPDPPARQLLSALCRELADSIELRSQLGPAKVIRLLGSAIGTDQTAVASQLVRDCLRRGEDFALLLESMERPSLDDAKAMIREIVPAILKVRQEHGLDAAADIALRTWLVDRTLTVDGKSVQLPFSELEGWLASTDGTLTTDLGASYLHALADELESDSPSDFDVAAAAARIKDIVDSAMPNGVESRKVIWVLLTRIVGVRQQDVCEMAMLLGSAHAAKADSEDIDAFVIAFARRLRNADDAYDDVDLEQSIKAMTSIVAARASEFDADTLTAVGALANYWIDDADAVKGACKLVDVVRQSNASIASVTLTAWAARLLTDFPDECIDYLGSEFPHLESGTQSAIVVALGPLVDSESVSKEAGENYKRFVEAFEDRGVWGQPPLKAYVDRLVPAIASRYANPQNYLHRVFPATTYVLKYGSPQVVGPALQQLFSQAKDNASTLYSFLHAWMANNWPVPGEQYPGYDPQTIFNDAQNFAASYPNNVWIGLLRSMETMIKRGVVPVAQKPKLIAAACSTWSANPLTAVDLIEKNAGDLSGEQAATLVRPIDWNNAEQVAALKRAWTAIARAMPLEQQIETCRRLLTLGTVGPADVPDRGLADWLSEQSDGGHALLAELLPAEGLEDAYRMRLWNQATAKAAVLGSGFFVEVVPRVVVLQNVDGVVAAIFDAQDRISAVVESENDRAELAKRLMMAFSNAKTVTTMGRIADYAHALAGRGALRLFHPSELSVEQYALLESRFKGAPDMKRLAAAVRRAAE